MNKELDFSSTGNGESSCFDCGATFAPDDTAWRDVAEVGDTVHCHCPDCGGRCASPVVTG